MERIGEKTQRGRGAEIRGTEDGKRAAFEVRERGERKEKEVTDGVRGAAEEGREGRSGRFVFNMTVIDLKSYPLCME